MPRHPQEPHLFTVRVDGHVTNAIRAMSQAEARDYYLAQHVVIERPTPVQAFRIGSLCELGIENAKDEYADPEDSIQIPLLPTGIDMGGVVDAEVGHE